jgi:uncharacterized protein DUF1501
MPSFDRGCAEYERLNRRDVLTAGMLGGVGLSLADLLRAEAAQTHSPPKVGGAREFSCIVLWLRGGPSSIDMWDLKPDAPAEIRGDFKPIRTNVSGIEISEHLPLCAKIADKYCLVRSVTHPSEDHESGSHINSTGWHTWPAQPYPMYGTVVQKLLGYRGALPPHIHLPEPPQAYSGGKHYLSRQDLPFTVSCLNDLDMKVRDVSLAPEVSPERFERRRRLLAAGGRESAPLALTDDTARTADVFQQRAFDLLTSPATRAAFDLTREPEKLRDRYGRGVLAAEIVAQGNAGDVAPNDYSRSIVGQGLLMARRLVEAGVRFVTVVGRGWDTHADNFNRLKTQLLPYVDRALYGLLTDLDERGMLERTLVVVTGDFNRTPKINRDAGRDHWGHVQTIFFAGGGVPGGTVIGASDANCAYPADRPIPAADVAATIFHKFGIRPDSEILAFDGRPFRVMPDGAQPIRELV